MENFLKQKKIFACLSSVISFALTSFTFLAIILYMGTLGLQETAFINPRMYFTVSLGLFGIQLIIKLCASTKNEKSAKKTYKVSLIASSVLALLYEVTLLTQIANFYRSPEINNIVTIILIALIAVLFLAEWLVMVKVIKYTLEQSQARAAKREALAKQKEEKRALAKQQDLEKQKEVTVQNVGQRSYFDGTLLQFVFYNFAWKVLNYITLGIMVPFTTCWALKWKYEHTVYSGKRLVFTGNGFSLIKKWILWIFLTLITFGIYSFWLKIKLEQWKAQHTVLADDHKNK